MSAEDRAGSGKVAVVTGGSRGIGRAIVERLARAGAAVRFSFARNEEAARSVVEQLTREGCKVEALRVDARDAAASRALVTETIPALGRLDILVNNAGITADRLLPLMHEDQWNDVLSTSLNGLFGTAQAASKQMMRQRSGRVVNLTSVSGLTGMAGQTNYSAAKAAIIGFTRSLAKELAPMGIPVNAVAPGYIDTDMTGVFTPEQRQAAIQRVPMRRFGTAEEVAVLVEWLVLRAPSYLTGQTLVLDGGLVA